MLSSFVSAQHPKQRGTVDAVQSSAGWPDGYDGVVVGQARDPNMGWGGGKHSGQLGRGCQHDDMFETRCVAVQLKIETAQAVQVSLDLVDHWSLTGDDEVGHRHEHRQAGHRVHHVAGAGCLADQSGGVDIFASVLAPQNRVGGVERARQGVTGQSMLEGRLRAGPTARDGVYRPTA